MTGSSSPDNVCLLLDTNVLYGRGDSFLAHMQRDSNRRAFTERDLQERLDILGTIKALREPILIDEVREEIRSYISKLNEHLSFINGTFSKPQRKKQRGFIERKERDEECKLDREDIETYVKFFYETFRHLSKKPSPVYLMHGKTKHLYNISLSIAERRRYNWCPSEKNLGRESSLGDRLHTDCKLIASTIALAYDAPSILITNDERLHKEFEFVISSLKRGAISASSFGRDCILHRYPTRVLYGLADSPHFTEDIARCVDNLVELANQTAVL